MARRESMIFYASWLDAISELPVAVRNEAQSAILEYGIEGTMPTDVGQTTKALMALIKPQIDANNVRYENGCRGGAPVGNQNARKNNQETTKNNQETTEKQPKTTYNDNVYDNDNNTLSLSLSQSEKEKAEGGVTATERERFFEIFYFRNAKHPAEEVERFINHYEVSGWRRNGSNRKVSNKYALAKSWKFEETTLRYDSCTASVLKKIEAACIEIGEHRIIQLLHNHLRKIDLLEDERLRICVADKSVADAIDAHREIFNKHLGRGWIYGILRKN